MTQNQLPGFSISGSTTNRSAGSLPKIDPNPAIDFSFEDTGSRSLMMVSGPVNGDEKSAQDLRLEISPFASLAGRQLNSSEIDWLRFALMVYAADRLSPRKLRGANDYDHWSRSIRLAVSVSSPATWLARKDDLKETLDFLTGDSWHLEFCQRSYCLTEEQQRHSPFLSGTEGPTLLFSGGLDSLSGAVDLFQRQNAEVLLVSGYTHNRLKADQELLVAAMRRDLSCLAGHLTCEFGFTSENEKKKQERESTQRTRGWMHVALGILGASIRSGGVLHLYENGIGAFNLSTEISQIPGQNSRSVHPLFLSRVAAIAGNILEKEIVIIQPAVFETKGELLQRVFKSEKEQNLIEQSLSCERYPNYLHKKNQCGICPSCLVRRAGLRGARLPDSGDCYQHDVVADGLPRAFSKQHGLSCMEAYVRRVRSCLNECKEGNAFVWEYPEVGSDLESIAKAVNLNCADFLKGLAELQAHFGLEWDHFANHVPGLRKPVAKQAA